MLEAAKAPQCAPFQPILPHKGQEKTRLRPKNLYLLPILLGAPEPLRPHRAIAIHEELQWSVVEWPYQLIVRPADNLVELYDLEHDPLQREDLSATKPDVVSQLKARYAEFPRVNVDRSTSGRSERDRLARLRPSHAP